METGYEREAEDAIDLLVEMMKKTENGRAKILNPVRYRQLHKAAERLAVILRETTDDFELEITTDPFFNHGAISVELENLCVEDPVAFSQMICGADNFEIYPLTNGKIRLDITFHAVLETIM